MIKNIKIQVADTCYGKEQTLDKFSKHNFIYGSNGTGKTTISRVIADESKFPGCQIQGIKITIRTYAKNIKQKSNYSNTVKKVVNF